MNKPKNISENLLRIFADNRHRFISGQALSEQLNCSRTAIWKHIRALEQVGYRFEAIPRRGYRLLEEPDRLDFSDWHKKLETKFMGKPVHYFETIDSTQTKAMQLIREGAEEGTLVIAEEQSDGKGRFNRGWHSPIGQGLWLSLILKPAVPLHFMPQLTLLVAVALCRTIRQLTGLDAGIKWPNDVLINGKKTAGILLESHVEDARLQHVIAGIGLNVNMLPSDFPEAMHTHSTSLRIEGNNKVERTLFLTHFLHELETWYIHFHVKGFSKLRMLWEALNVTLDRQITVRTGTETYEGKAIGIDESGALLLKIDSGEIIKCFSGESTLQTNI